MLRILSALVRFFDRIFDSAYGSKYNPLYRSGTLATGLLFLVIISGVYLIFEYRLSAPYESIALLSHGLSFGGVLRSFHRYASDAAMVAIGFHFLRMVIEKKTWGPRTLAWISGMILMGIFVFSGWTGFILVWDRQGQMVAMAGAKMADSLGLLSEPISRSFNGVTPVLTSFFFMNLFLHVALPLGMIAGLWIHTYRLARSAWFPPRKVLIVAGCLLLLLSIFIPAQLASPPDLLIRGGKEPIDLFFNLWLLLPTWISPALALATLVGIFVFFTSFPAWFKPKNSEQKLKSQHDEAKCTGCSQCYQDCPFEAISMIPRQKNPDGKLSELIARVHSDLCTACGICAGSCTQLAIGPPDRSGRVQMEKFKGLPTTRSGSHALVYCQANYPKHALGRVVNELQESEPGSEWTPVPYDCIGNLHPAVLQVLQHHYDQVATVGCPDSLCSNREGPTVFKKRIFDRQSPAEKMKLDEKRFTFVQGTPADHERVVAAIRRQPQGDSPSILTWVKATALSLVILGIITVGSRWPASLGTTQPELLLSWKFPRPYTEECRELTTEEMSKLPQHMMRSKECTKTTVPYRLNVLIDDKLVHESIVTPKGARGDRPIYVDLHLPVSEGTHLIDVRFEPREPSNQTDTLARPELKFEASFRNGRAVIVSWEANQGLYWKQ